MVRSIHCFLETQKSAAIITVKSRLYACACAYRYDRLHPSRNMSSTLHAHKAICPAVILKSKWVSASDSQSVLALIPSLWTRMLLNVLRIYPGLNGIYDMLTKTDLSNDRNYWGTVNKRLKKDHNNRTLIIEEIMTTGKCREFSSCPLLK